MTDRTASETLPVGGSGTVSTAWWGMACLIATEAILFVYLIFSYVYLGSQQTGPWPPTGPPSLKLVIPNTVILVASSFVVAWGQSQFRQTGNSLRLALALAGTIILGSAFIIIQAFEWAGKGIVLSTSAYSSAFFILTGVHMAHVAVGLLILTMLLVWTLMGRFRGVHHEHIALGALYWHFVDVVWIVVFITAYVVPQFS
ncbi:cytochrome c oxidase subunit 3 [Mesorhizobium sp. INR15]|uniref:cytochrome c oxidase subunit 3 n=1 Tax=Mesorhizobium sp. INR15 TaxID=2654248 RepID=UPI0018965BF8|nr:cytochrome c oxidase subunit 3 [Mesorhizobium sp. INR15]QPC95665.1 heme-copper oxidase subunit III [Mesorhizobium sp. INR15]QPC96001.1 heme-copper oxidase subunit III [Mesorhizobium sp. INR15]